MEYISSHGGELWRIGRGGAMLRRLTSNSGKTQAEEVHGSLNYMPQVLLMNKRPKYSHSFF